MNIQGDRILGICCMAMLAATACLSEEGTSGLVGMKETVVENGKAAWNGYVFTTNAPEEFTGVVSYAFGTEGVLGIRGRADNDNYGAWELRPDAKLPPGGPYQASVSIRHSRLVDKPHIGIEIYSFDAEGRPRTLLHVLHDNGVVDKWHRISGEFMVPEDSARLRVRVDLTSSGELFLRDLRVGARQTPALKAAQPYDKDAFDFTTGYVADEEGLPASELPVEIRRHDGPSVESTVPWNLALEPGLVKFTLNGEAGINRSMKWAKTLETPVSLEGMRFFSIKYRARGVLRTVPVSALVLLKGSDAGGRPMTADLLTSSIAFDDGQFHTVTGKLPESIAASGISVQLKTCHSRTVLEIADISFSAGLPLEDCPAGHKDPGFSYVDMGALFNEEAARVYEENLEKHGILVDRILGFPQDGGPVQVEGVPFMLGPGPRNVARPPFNDSRNQETFPFLGETGTRKNIAPFSREDHLEIPVGASGGALYLLMLNGCNPEQPRYTLGRRPLRLDDMENLTVILKYADGHEAKAFPYSLENKAFYISGRCTGVYAVKLDEGRTLEKAVLGFYSRQVNLLPAAVTVGQGEPAFAGLLDAAPRRELPVRRPSAQEPKVRLEGKKLEVNGFVFDLSEGLALAGIPRGSAAKASGLAVRKGNEFWSGRNLLVANAVAEGKRAKLTLTAPAGRLEGLAMDLDLEANDCGGLIWRATLRNLSESPMDVQVSPGAILGLAFGDGDELCFPRFRMEISGEEASYRARYGQEFMHQFMDFFNPDKNCGIMVLVDNRSNSMLEFTASKRRGGMNGAVTLLERYSRLEPGDSLELAPVTWQPHEGDWHTALALYRDFLQGFYRTGVAQNHRYFLESMVNNCYHTTHTLSWRFYKVPPLLSKDKRIWHIDEVDEFERRHLGRRLDFVHLWWSYNDAEDRFQYGHWASDGFYAQSGGLESFREAIRHYQEDLGINVSLYTISDRVKNADVKGTGFDPQTMVKAYPDGSMLVNETESYTCFCSDAWVDYAVKDLAKLMKDTGAKILYSDVISSFSGSVCHSKSHGHGTPSNPVLGDLKFMSRLRKELSEDVSIWTEYGQPDTTSMYSDGFISYYFQELQEFFAPVCDKDDRSAVREFEVPMTAVRFLLPRYKLFTLPVGLEVGNKPSQVDYAFFNGETFHEDTWFMHDSRVRKRLNRALEIKDKFKDCFLTDAPEPRVQTLAGGIYSNRFPGKGRTLWTVYNATAATVEKPLLAIPHITGARYYDAWNSTWLEPKVADGMAVVTLRLDPQCNGAVVQELP